MNRVILFGSRTWPWMYYDHIKQRIAQLPADTLIVHGACLDGVDFFVDECARMRCMTIERHPANWRELGRAAGPRRNAHMAQRGAVLAIGFRMPGKSNGTDNMADEAELCRIPVERHGWDWPKAAGF
jgi:hypothetical protein